MLPAKRKPFNRKARKGDAKDDSDARFGMLS